MKAILAANLTSSKIPIMNSNDSYCSVPIYIKRELCDEPTIKILLELDPEFNQNEFNSKYFTPYVKISPDTVFFLSNTHDSEQPDLLEITYCEPIKNIVDRVTCYILKKHIKPEDSPSNLEIGTSK